jgi:ribosomal-protein-alanine N-acetyltransferase
MPHLLAFSGSGASYEEECLNEATRLFPPHRRPRPARLDDLADLCLLDHDIFGKLAYPYFVLRQWFDVHGEHFVVIDSSSARAGLCGYAMVALEPSRETAWLLGLGVHEDHRGRGFGDVLMSKAIEICEKAGAKQIKITVRPTNDAALGVYTKAGFSQVDEENDYFGAGEPRLLLMKRN